MKLERAQTALVAAVAATCSVSIFAAQILFTIAAIVFVVRLARGQARIPRLPLDGPTLAFCVWTLLFSAAFSQAPLRSQESAKKLVLFGLLYLAVDSQSDRRARERIMDAALLGGLVLAAGSLLQYYFLGYDTINQRPRGFLGHYMTASGLLMATALLSAARLAFFEGELVPPSREDLHRLAGLGAGLVVLAVLGAAGLAALEAERAFVALLALAAAHLALTRGAWPGRSTSVTLAALALPFASWALLISRTRNAWLGTLTGLAVIALLRAPRLLWGLAAAVALVLVLRPAAVTDRLTLTDASSRDRYFMWQAGIDMVRDRPVFGQGPRMVESNYPAYRWPGAPNPATPHLHNNVLQIAAERGLPCLAWWLWWVAAAMGDAYRETRAKRSSSAVASLALLAGVMTAGLFEYNFGDSEILMLLLVVCALPYALRVERGETEPEPPALAPAPAEARA